MKGYTPLANCTKCPKKFHCSCLGREDNKLLRTNKFICPGCKIKNKAPRCDSTPVRGQHESKEGVTNQDFLSSVQSLATMQVPTQALASFTTALQQLQQVFVSMKDEMCSFTKALNSTSQDIDQFRTDLTDMKRQLKELDGYKIEVTNLRAEVAELRLALSSREQRALLKDIEINGITEQKEENLQQIVTVISSKLGVELDPRDVDDVRRVGLRGGGAGGLERPRPVVITFTRRAARDQMLRASRVRRGLTTDAINIGGNSRRVYINEHLTKANRVLFSKARSVGSELNFKYVWTSNGGILMRRSDTSSILRVTSESILEKLQRNTGGSGNTQTPPSGETENCS